MPTDPVRRGAAFLAVALLLVAIAGPAAAVPWFRSDPGPTFTYSFGTVVISDGGPPADFSRSRCTAGAPWDPQAPPVPVTLFGAVVGPATATVPAGTFDVIKVHLLFICIDQPWRNWTRELWLNHSLGPVNDLVSWTGVVDVGSISCGSLKASYR